MLRKLIFSGVFFFVATAGVFADQAAWIEKSEAYKAAEMINPGAVLRRYCPPCGDTVWTDVTIRQIKVKKTDTQSYQVFINEKGTDLAYTYIEKNGKWMNLAMILGLKVSDVPEFLSDQKTSAPGNTGHPTDQFLEKCMAKDSTTLGMTDCVNKAYQRWDDELNKVYKQLRSVLNPDQKKSLKNAQLKWIKYRDSEFALIENIYSSFQGSMFTPMRAGDRMEIVKKRTLEIKAYLDLNKEY